MPDPKVPPQDAPAQRPPWASGARGLAVSIVASWVVPLVVFHLARPHVDSDATALVIAGAIPVAWTLGRLALQRRVDPIALISVAGFALGLVVLALTGGNSFLFKVREPVITGLLGLVCLASVLIRRPLALPLIRKQVPSSFGETAVRRAAMWITAILGATLAVHGVVLIVVAASVSTSTYLSVQTPVGLVILAVGLGALIWSRNRRLAARARAEAATPPRDPQAPPPGGPAA